MLMKKLRLGIPTGSLEKATVDLFARSGWRINISSRNYFPEIDDQEIVCSLARAQEMARYVESGLLDCGLTGKDWVEENASKVIVVDDLIYSKVSSRAARWVLAVPENSPYQKPQDLAGKKISTELVGFTKRWFAKNNIDVDVEFSWGATEAKVISGLADAIVEVTETGSTIRANGLRIIHELMQTNTQLVANYEAWDNPWKKAKIKQISLLLKAALKAGNLVGIKLNSRQRDADAIIELLPSLNAPTVANLYKSDWVSIETVISEQVVREIVPQLIARGAEGIIEYPLNKVI